MFFFFFFSFLAFQGARGLPGERGRTGAAGAAVSAHGRTLTCTRAQRHPDRSRTSSYPSRLLKKEN